MLLQQDGRLVGVAGWQVENLVTRVTDLHLEEGLDAGSALAVLIREVESASNALQSEAALIFARNDLSKQEALWKELGYEKRSPENLGVQAWQEAALESAGEGSVLFFKPLRHDRVLRPI
jgi:dephospho-CoA kinase